MGKILPTTIGARLHHQAQVSHQRCIAGSQGGHLLPRGPVDWDILVDLLQDLGHLPQDGRVELRVALEAHVGIVVGVVDPHLGVPGRDAGVVLQGALEVVHLPVDQGGLVCTAAFCGRGRSWRTGSPVTAGRAGVAVTWERSRRTGNAGRLTDDAGLAGKAGPADGGGDGEANLVCKVEEAETTDGGHNVFGRMIIRHHRFE